MGLVRFSSTVLASSGEVRARAIRALAAVVLCAAAAGACIKTQPYAKLSETAEPLRARFNQDVGRVRVMMLVAPT